MWKPLSPPYLIKVTKENEIYVGVTNHERYWASNLSKKSFLADLKESNDLLEFDDENEFIKRGLDMLSNPETLKKVSILQGDLGKLLTITMIKVYECSFKLGLSLQEASSEYFFNAVTQPLLKTVCDLRSSQHELRELLKYKDREIERYRNEGRVPKRSQMPIYDDAAHMSKHTTFEEFFNAPEIPEVLQAAANASVLHDIKPILDPLLPAKTRQKGHETTAETSRSPLLTENSASPKKVPKIEKHSQNTPIDETASILPMQTDETDIPKLVIQSTVKLEDVKPDAKHPRKRPKNRLNY